jgi:hypothetical protein
MASIGLREQRYGLDSDEFELKRGGEISGVRISGVR